MSNAKRMNDTAVTILISKEMKEGIDRAAKEDNRDRTGLVRHWLHQRLVFERWMEKPGQQK